MKLPRALMLLTRIWVPVTGVITLELHGCHPSHRYIMGAALRMGPLLKASDEIIRSMASMRLWRSVSSSPRRRPWLSYRVRDEGFGDETRDVERSKPTAGDGNGRQFDAAWDHLRTSKGVNQVSDRVI